MHLRERHGLYSFHLVSSIPAERQRPICYQASTAIKAIRADSASSLKANELLRLWHIRLGHLNHADTLALLQLPGSLLGKDSNSELCKVCVESKQRRRFIRKPVPRTTRPFELIHSDLCGPITPPSHSGKRYFILYIDDYSRTAFAYFLHTKTANEIVSVFQEFLSRIEAMLPDVKFSRFRCDNARGEYDNSLMRGILRVSGISFEPSPPYSQHKNGVSEHMIRTIATKARSMLLDSQLELEFWAEAVSTAAYLHTRSPSRTLDGKTPYEMLWQKKPSLDHLRRFGCAAYRLIPKDQRSGKFASRSRECIMIGYVHSSTTIWKLWDRSRKSLVQASDVTFDESTVLGITQAIEASAARKYAEIFSSCVSDDPISDVSLEDINGDISYELVPVLTSSSSTSSSAGVLPVATGHESRATISTPPLPASEVSAAVRRQSLRRSLRNRIANLILQATMAEATRVVHRPVNYEDALAHSESQYWRSAMRAEFTSLLENQTWEYVDCATVPSHKSVLGCQWVYKIKVNPDRSMRYKARLVIKGYQQVAGIDFDDTFAPVAKLVSFRLLIAIAAYYGWPLEQMDVITAFLNPPVTEELYMEPPEGVEWLGSVSAGSSDLALTGKVCRLRKALYGLKQAPRLWYHDIHSFLLSEDMIQSDSDTNLYYSPNSKLLILLYVDDILLTGPSLPIIDRMKNHLRNRYRMSDLGAAKKYIGIEIERQKHCVVFH